MSKIGIIGGQACVAALIAAGFEVRPIDEADVARRTHEETAGLGKPLRGSYKCLPPSNYSRQQRRYRARKG